jgi:osmotically-inducible protein OsmY
MKQLSLITCLGMILIKIKIFSKILNLLSMADYNSYRGTRSYDNERDWDQVRRRRDYDRYYNPMRSSNNIYGGDTRNYGNANQGGYDRNWWDRTVDKVSSWLGGDESGRNSRMNRLNPGGQRGKGPKGYVRSENRIKEDVYERLTEDDKLDATNVDVQVQSDTVILSGTVQSREEKRRAEDLVERIPGVRNVENRIHIDYSTASGFTDRYQY